MRMWAFLDDVRLDVRYALRTMRTERTVGALAVLTLAFGIGANTAIFSLINALMLRDLPVQAPEQLVAVLSQYPGEPRSALPWKFYAHYRDHNHVFADLIATSVSRFRVAGDGFEAEVVEGGHVSGNYFPALGVRPALGRLIGPQDDRLDTTDAAVAVLSWPYWKSRFNLDPTIVGRRILIEEVPATVIGVAPREFFGLQTGLRPDVWVPAAMAPPVARAGGQADGRAALDRLPVGVMGRLKPGVSLARAQAEMEVLDRLRIEEIARRNPDPLIRQLKIHVIPARAGFSLLQDQWATPLFVMMAVVAIVLLVACVNVAAMMLARGARQRDMAVRLSLGAGRFRLARQVLTESFLISSIASLLGLWVAYVGADALVRMLGMARLRPRFPRGVIIDVQPDLHVLLFTTGAAALTALLFGMAPAWSAFRAAPVGLLRHAGDTRARRWFGNGLVVAQVALSLALLSTGGLFVSHLSSLRGPSLGFQHDSVLLVALDPRNSGHGPEALGTLNRELLARVHAIPGVRAATLSGMTPLSGAGRSELVNLEGFQEAPGARRYVSVNGVAPRYFETFGTPLIAGRDFEPRDEGGARVAIVNQAMARYYFGDGNPLGRQVTFDDDGRTYGIVGVVGDAKYGEMHERPPRTIYLNLFQDALGGSALALRTDVAPAAVAADVRRAVRDVMQTVEVARVTTLTEQVDASLVPERLLATLSGWFALLGAGLTAIGLYGVLAFGVVRRVREIGVRMALGASRGDVMRMVLGGALGMVFAGLAAGVPLAWSIERLTRRFVLVSTGASLPVIVCTAAAIMLTVALLAAFVPTRRASRIAPAEALRHD